MAASFSNTGNVINEAVTSTSQLVKSNSVTASCQRLLDVYYRIGSLTYLDHLLPGRFA